MVTFFQKTSKAFLVLIGVFTVTPLSLAFAPKLGLDMIFSLNYLQEYTIFIQHWGIVIPTIGICIVIAAFKTEWRVPVLSIAAVGKLFFFIFYLINMNNDFAKGFSNAAWIDLIAAIYFIFYLIYHKALIKEIEINK